MDNEANQPTTSGPNWTPTQTYAMAAVCLLIGVLVGYLVRGSANPAGQATPASAEMQQAATAPPSSVGQQKMPTLDDMKRMADKQAEPLLAKLKTDPKNVDLLNKTRLTTKRPTNSKMLSRTSRKLSMSIRRTWQSALTWPRAFTTLATPMVRSRS